MECTVAGRGRGEGAGDVLLCESAECSDPFDWWCCSDRRFRFVLLLVWNLEGELVVLFVLLPLRRKRQSPSNVVVICVERTEMELSNFLNKLLYLLFNAQQTREMMERLPMLFWDGN